MQVLWYTWEQLKAIFMSSSAMPEGVSDSWQIAHTSKPPSASEFAEVVHPTSPLDLLAGALAAASKIYISNGVARFRPATLVSGIGSGVGPGGQLIANDPSMWFMIANQAKFRCD